eukprot:TRINITY_DN4190_c0_g1_i1.p1 TRINITY_DN4190_c0_g1~~TRINITY_DN4190_c0_g1_i1.p1  ORF type:complete len:227 (+),score=40.73 TRINITY_DN4190_c0_g1_i1:89-769(+)
MDYFEKLLSPIYSSDFSDDEASQPESTQVDLEVQQYIDESYQKMEHDFDFDRNPEFLSNTDFNNNSLSCQLTLSGILENFAQDSDEVVEECIKMNDQELEQDVKEGDETQTRNFRETKIGDQNIYINNGEITQDTTAEIFVMTNEDFGVTKLPMNKSMGRYSFKTGGNHRNSMIFIRVTKGNRKRTNYYGFFDAYSKKGGKGTRKPKHSEDEMLRKWKSDIKKLRI